MIFIHETAVEKENWALAGKMAAEVAKYLYPQKKATELANPEGEELVIRYETVGRNLS